MEEMGGHLKTHHLTPGIEPQIKSREIQSLNWPEEEEAEDAQGCAVWSPQTPARKLSQGKHVFLSSK